MSEQQSWDSRFAGVDYLFGKEPSVFLKEHSTYFARGMKVLTLADGEGRNGVWLASQGLAVTSTEFSATAIAKAKTLATENQVSLTFLQEDVATRHWEPEAFDAVVAIFIQFAGPTLRKAIFEGIVRTLRPNGLLLLQGYRPKQIEYATGGPRAVENLYSRNLLEDAFQSLEIIQLNEHDSILAEGQGHRGRSALIDLVARKPGN